MNEEVRVHNTWILLKYAYGGLMLLFGLDKLLLSDLINDWTAYLHPNFVEFSFLHVSSLLILLGLIEAIIAVLILTRFTKIGAYSATAWFFLSAVNFLLLRMTDLALVAVVLGLGTVVLAWITDLRAYIENPEISLE